MSIAACVGITTIVADWLVQRGTLDGVRVATRLAPGCSEYLDRYAMIAAGRTNGAYKSRTLLERAAAIDPLNSDVMIRLALLEESEGALARAQALLTRATEYDHQFRPEWALTNFCARSGAEDCFWTHARLSLKLSNGANWPVFRLCHRISDDPGTVVARVIGLQTSALSSYLSFLINTGRLSSAHQVALKTLGYATRADALHLIAYCDKSIETGSFRAAVPIWNGLVHQGLLPQCKMRPSDAPIVDSHFACNPTSHGFDWHPVFRPGITWSTRSMNGLQATFERPQQDGLTLLTQAVLLNSGRRYRMELQYRSEAPSVDLSVEIPGVRGVITQALTAGPGKQIRLLRFEIPNGSDCGTINILYRRPPYERLREDTVTFQSLSLTEVP